MKLYLILAPLPCCMLAFTTRPTVTRQRIHNRAFTFRAAAAAETVENKLVGRNVEDIDPLLTNILLRDGSLLSSLGEGGSSISIMTASAGLKVWRSVLVKGRLPVQADFNPQQFWPPETLFLQLSNAMAEMQLPRFVLRHPETVNTVLLTLLRLTTEFAARRTTQFEEEEQESPTSRDENDESLYNAQVQVDLPNDNIEQEALAEELASGLMDEWGGVIGGVHALDHIFGANHGLLDCSVDPEQADTDAGFGLQDGIWQHSGWTVLPELQRQLASMPELRDLVKSLGRRPTAENSDAVHKFVPRKLDLEGAMGAQYDPSIPTSVSGLTLSDSLSEMLPSEAVLLRGASPALRWLFLAKKAESKLLSYQLSGWADTPSIPRTARPRSRMPSAPGGPIVVCLDTSWSMSGMREQLSKAVTLACVTAAHKQRRDCQVVAFSTENGVMETGKITADPQGVQRLLDFLSHSFGGGTDVTGALKHAMTALGGSSSDDDVDMSAADVLLVSDGEIPDPPVSEEMMQDLDRLKRRTGMQVLGLLVGKSESKPLTKLCTQTHVFLVGYEHMLATTLPFKGDPVFSSSETHTLSYGLSSQTSLALSAVPSGRFRRTQSAFSFARARSRHRYGVTARALFHKHTRRSSRDPSVALHAKYSVYSGEGEQMRKRDKKRNRHGKKQRWDDEEDEFLDAGYSDSTETEIDDQGGDVDESTAGSYNARVENAVDSLKVAVAASLKEQAWTAAELDSEKNGEKSCWRYRSELQAAVDRVSEGLIERDVEARLVVLGMSAREHVLLLGPPGTGKSALGRRLSQLCGGQFFQRLLTRFTTPEEIFGPLSLRSLENDEYKRCTAGFLPTASVAFLDEIFKANSAILNTLLTILNERQFDNGAGRREECPIRCVVGASNEMPESDELDALYDRFLLRKEVLPVSDDGVMRILSMPTPGYSPCDKNDDTGSDAACDVVFSDGLDRVVEALSTAANTVHMGEDACALLRDMRTFLRENLDVNISDRRLVKAARLLKVSAACHGRSSVDSLDCLLLQHIAWQFPEQRTAVREWIWDHLTPGGTSANESPAAAVAQFRLLLDGIRREAMMAVRKASGDVSGASGARETDVAVIRSLQTEASRVASLLQQRSASLARHMELLRRSMDHLWLDPDEAQAAQQLLLPRAETVSKEVYRALADARALVLALSEDAASPSNDLRLSVIELLWDEGYEPEISFTDEELGIGMREAKAKYDPDTFRKWKRARKKANK